MREDTNTNASAPLFTGYDDRTRASLLALGQGLAMLNGRIGAAEGLASVTNDFNVAAFRTVEERLDAQDRRLDAQDRRLGELQAALVSLARAIGMSPVWNDEGDGGAPTTH